LKALGFITVIITGLLLLQAQKDFPDWGAAESPANSYRLSQHYITQTFSETTVPNMVTAVLADYRGYDTMFETVVTFTAGIAIIGILRTFGASGKPEHPEPRLTKKKPDLIIETTCRLLIPIIQLFALYVVAHGHHSPGGGFQGGVIFGAAFILLALSRDLQAAQKWVPENRVLTLAAIGIFIYAGFGVVALLLGENFLDYGALTKILPGGVEDARSHSMLGIEIGVAFTVTAIMFSIYSNLSSNGKMKEGI
jgi:multicomponent Na+:H+ antiporter subunit B